MKRMVCILLSLILISSISFAENSYTLPEKMANQMKVGSGLKGKFTLHMDGTDPLILSLMPFQYTEMQLHSIQKEDKKHISIFQAGENDSRIALTELLKENEIWFLRSEMLQNQVYQIPGTIELADLLHQPKGGNVSFASVIARWFDMNETKRHTLLDPVMEKLSRMLEVWLADYADVSDVIKIESGISAVNLTYSIPMSEIRKEIVSLLQELIRDKDGQALINALLSTEQKSIYTNEYLDYFYLDAMDSLDNDYDLLYTRTITTLGQLISSSMEMPLDETSSGFQSLIIEDNGGLISFTLQGDDSMLKLLIPDNIDFSQIDSLNAWIIWRSAKSADKNDGNQWTPLSLKINIHHKSELTSDEENREHLTERWSIQAERDLTYLPEGEEESDYPEITPIVFDVSLHYYSRISQSSPTTLELDALMEKENFQLSLDAEFKTTAPWVFDPFPTEEAIELAEMNQEERAVILAEWLTAAGEQLTRERVSESGTNESQTDGYETEEAENEKASF